MSHDNEDELPVFPTHSKRAWLGHKEHRRGRRLGHKHPAINHVVSTWLSYDMTPEDFDKTAAVIRKELRIEWEYRQKRAVTRKQQELLTFYK